jgi:DNA-binding GntR family transcriptional regulator
MSNTNFLGHVESLSRKDRTLTILREAILKGRINPGEPIVESKVAQQLGVGQPLVREALIELDHQGLVQRIPYRGTYVRKLSREDIEKIFHVRIELEALAAKWAKDNAKSVDIAALRAFLSEMKQAAEALDLDQFYKSDLAFHRKLWALSENEYLADALERVVVPLFAFFVMKGTRVQKSYIDSVAIHGRIVDAIETNCRDSLRQLIRDVLGEMREQCFDQLLPESPRAR